MARMTFVLLLVLVGVSACMALLPNPKPKDCCGKNEIWMDCGNSCTEPKCDGSHLGVACPAVCMARCQCKEGTLRNNLGECVEPCDCPGKAVIG